ncbi:MAG: heparinase II/III family protein [Verrucomicrobia bacterium]|nr:heparinase II/III family protein [Verrucomicrobiota bacterium]
MTRYLLGLRPVLWLGVACALCQAQAAPGAQPQAVPLPAPAPDAVLNSLVKGHPRLLVSKADLARLKDRVASEEPFQRWHAGLRERAARVLREAPSTYEIPDGLRLLATSRRVLQRVYTLALLHHLDGDPRYRERAWRELEAAAGFKDWNPRHFLDTAEMTHALAIGYDWLHGEWTEAQRGLLRAAMVEKGLKLAVRIHQDNRGWSRSRHNWNQVCNGGIAMGALALADVEPELAGRFLSAAVGSIQRAMVEYGPDGAWAEGPGYWSYATTYNVVFLAALQTALGTDFGLCTLPGFSEAGTFPIHASGPSGLSFNYADAHAGTIRAPVMFWLARQFQRPEFAQHQRGVAGGEPLDLAWYDASLATKPAPAPPLDKYYRHAEVAVMRGAWDDANAWFVGFKAGDNKANHSHLDLGSFVLEAHGVRWGVDLGADNYNLPAYFGNRRWTYYRLRAEGHNTLVLNPDTAPDQDPAAAAPIIKFASSPARAAAVADLTAAYVRHAQRVRRGIALLDRRQVLVQDEVRAKQPATLWWFFHTSARIGIDAGGATATLTQNGSAVSARILAPAGARFVAMNAEPLPESPHPPRQGSNDRCRKLAIQLKDVTDLRLAVAFAPAGPGRGAAAPPLIPLDAW